MTENLGNKEKHKKERALITCHPEVTRETLNPPPGFRQSMQSGERGSGERNRGGTEVRQPSGSPGQSPQPAGPGGHHQGALPARGAGSEPTELVPCDHILL